MLLVTACAASDDGEAPIRLTGPIHGAEDLSAVENLGGRLVIASDEEDQVQLLDPLDDGSGWQAREDGIPLTGSGEEVDVEGLARRNTTLFVLGSHALKRRLLDPKATRSENRQRLASVPPETYRHFLFRVEIDPASGEPAAPVESISLRPLLQRDPLLAPFTRIPGKENGINMEGIAAHDSRLYVGFRSPVLREGQVPVMVLDFDEPAGYELRFVQLGGRGIRSMARVEEGFLLVARSDEGPRNSFGIFLWDGRDQLPGRDVSPTPVRLLAELPPGSGAPEGLAVLEENEQGYQVLVVYDGVAGGNPVQVTLPRP